MANKLPSPDPAASRFHRVWDTTGRIGLHELVVLAAAFGLYFFVRGAVVDREHLALSNARDLIALERRLGLYHEATMQGWVLDSYWTIKVLNGIYFWGHMPLVVVLATWLWFRHRYEYVITRNEFLASGAIAIVIYWLLPVAPPRLVPEAGLLDTMAIYDRVSYNAQETGAFVNQYAAVPSLHFGWSLLLGMLVGWVRGRWWSWLFGAAWGVAMLLAIVLTGNHFFLDAVAGGVVSFAGLGVAVVLDRRWPHVFTRINGVVWMRSGPVWDQAKPPRQR